MSIFIYKLAIIICEACKTVPLTEISWGEIKRASPSHNRMPLRASWACAARGEPPRMVRMTL